MLHRAKEELHLATEYYEAKVSEFSCHLSLKKDQIEQMQSEIEDKFAQLEHQQKHEEETHGIFSQEILMLRAEIERLRTENNILSENTVQKENLTVELEPMKTSIKEIERQVERKSAETSVLETKISLSKMDDEKSMRELEVMRCLKDKKGSLVENLQSEVEIRSHCDSLKHSLFKNELEKERLRKQAFQLKSDLKKREDAVMNTEKKLKDSNSRAAVLEGTKATPRNSKSDSLPRGSKEIANLKEKIKLL